MSAGQALTDRLDDREKQHHEAPKDERVDGAGDGIAEDLRLSDSNSQHAFYSLSGLAEAVGPLAEAEKIDEALAVNDDPGKCRDEDERENNGFDHAMVGQA